MGTDGKARLWALGFRFSAAETTQSAYISLRGLRLCASHPDPRPADLPDGLGWIRATQRFAQRRRGRREPKPAPPALDFCFSSAAAGGAKHLVQPPIATFLFCDACAFLRPGFPGRAGLSRKKAQKTRKMSGSIPLVSGVESKPANPRRGPLPSLFANLEFFAVKPIPDPIVHNGRRPFTASLFTFHASHWLLRRLTMTA